jgi:transglutaminase-like putative cysteine protease
MRSVLSFLIWMLLALPLAAQVLERADAPDWVEVLPIPPADPALRAEALDGVNYLLSEHQIRWVGEESQTYGRTVMEVTDRAGLELAANLSFDFDPAFDRIILTRLVVIRDGKETDLRDTLKDEVFRRETRLEEGIIDGSLTAVVQVPDLRVGDIVDSASIRVTTPVIPAGQRSGVSVLEWDVPVGVSRTVLFWPQDWPLTLGPVPARVSHEVSAAKDGVIRHEWRRVGHIPPRIEESVPIEADPTAIVRFSDTADWSALVAALTPYYAADYPLTPEWEEKLAALIRDNPTVEARAIAALRLVQDELRYVSLSMGVGGYFARLPDEVIRSGFGDCKEKSLLLRVLLGRMGIEAQVALTDLDAGYALPMELPTLGAFDHMIVRIVVDGQSHWVDPTASHQGGGFATAAPPDYGFALPLAGEGQHGLEAIVISPENAWSTDVTERFQFTPLGVAMDVTTIYQGGAADNMRERWARTPASQITADYLDYYSGRYPGLRVLENTSIRDDRQANRLEMLERYFLPNDALADSDLSTQFAFSADDFTANLPDHLSGTRQAPLLVGGPAKARHRVVVRGAPIEFTPPEDVRISNPAFDFSLTGTTREGGGLDLVWTFGVKARVVPAEAAAGVIKDGAAVYDLTWFSWDLTGESPTVP